MDDSFASMMPIFKLDAFIDIDSQESIDEAKIDCEMSDFKLAHLSLVNISLALSHIQDQRILARALSVISSLECEQTLLQIHSR